MNLPAIKLAAIKHKLQWSADGEWSAYLTPEECHLVLKELNNQTGGNDGERRENQRIERCTEHP